MPAPRNCRSCGAALSPHVRWCGQCYEPIHEFTARAPLHPGDFAGIPIHEGANVSHWSRWDRSVTTFGPVGRVVMTVVLFASLPIVLAQGYFLYLIMFPLVAAALLREIWARGWVVPDEPNLPPLPITEHERLPSPRLTRAMKIWRIAWIGGGFAAILVVAYGSIDAKAAVLGLTALLGMWWFIRGFLAR